MDTQLPRSTPPDPPPAHSLPRTSIVTGAGHGIGRAIATGLHHSGHRVLIADIDREAAEGVASELDPQGHTAVAHTVDVSKRAAVDAMPRTALDRWAGVDVLVNNAALSPGTDLWSLDDAEWDAVMAVNLRGVFLDANSSEATCGTAAGGAS